MAALSLMAVFAVVLGAERAGLRVLREQPWLIGIGLAFLISGIGRLRVGGNLNNLLPVYTLLCLAPAFLTKISATQPVYFKRLREAYLIWWRYWLISALILLQFGLGRYYPPRYNPTAAMPRSAERLIERIASFPGNVLVMMHPYYTVLAGKDPSTQIATMWYVRERGALPLPEDFVERIQNHYYSAIISDESFFEKQADLLELITTYYVQAERLNAGFSPPTITGVTVRPGLIYLPKLP